MRARLGVTLLEVLIAIFIMGIGLLALLALFPLGATTMAQAMRDARCAEAGHNAKSTCFAQNIMHDSNVNPLYLSGGGGGGATLLGPDWNGPSYPVFVDAIGVHYIGLGLNAPLAPNVPRTSSILANNNSSALRWNSLHDDYTFDNSGSANIAGTGVERESRYTWAYLMKLPNIQSPSVVDINVVVYQGRNLQVQGGETLYQASATGTKTLVVRYNNGNKPNIKKGGWILDVTFYDPSPNAPTRPLALKYGPVPGNFYRVVDITDVNIAGIGPALEVELQTDLVSPQNTIPPVQNILVLDNVAEVFSIGTGWKAGVVGAPGVVQ